MTGISEMTGITGETPENKNRVTLRSLFCRKNMPVIAAVIVAVLLIVLYILSVTDVSPEKTGYLFMPEDSEEIRTVTIKNQYGTFSFSQDENNEWKVSDGSGTYYTNDDKISLLKSGLLHFPVLRILEEDREEYGLGSPVAAVSFETSAGRTGTVVVGASGANVNEYYARAAGVDGVIITDSTCVNQLTGSLAAYRTNEVFVVDLAKLSSIEYYVGGEEQIKVCRDGNGDWSLAYPFESGARNLEMNEFVSGLTVWSVAGYPEEFIPSIAGAETIVFTDTEGKTQTIALGFSDGTKRYARIDGRDDVVTLYDTDIDLSILNPEDLVYENPLYYPLKDVTEVHMDLSGTKLDFAVDAETDLVSLNGTYVDHDLFTGVYFRYVLLLADGHDAEPHPGEKTASFETVLKDGTHHTLVLYKRDENTCYMEYPDSDGNIKQGFYLDNVRLSNLLERLETLSDAWSQDKTQEPTQDN